MEHCCKEREDENRRKNKELLKNYVEKIKLEVIRIVNKYQEGVIYSF